MLSVSQVDCKSFDLPCSVQCVARWVFFSYAISLGIRYCYALFRNKTKKYILSAERNANARRPTIASMASAQLWKCTSDVYLFMVCFYVGACTCTFAIECARVWVALTCTVSRKKKTYFQDTLFESISQTQMNWVLYIKRCIL